MSKVATNTNLKLPLKGYSQNMRIVNRKFYIDRIGRFGQFQCKLVCKRTQNICKNV